MRAAIVAVGCACLVLSGPPAAAEEHADPVKLAPHRAVYDLSLARSSGSRGVESARGRIAFDFGGDACDGYTLNYRQVTILDSGETGTRTLDVRTATFEAGDGRSMRFKTDSTMEGMSGDSVDGDADTNTDGSLSIRLKRPKPETLEVPGGLAFPTGHMRMLIEAARKGETTVATRLYDGSDNGRKIYDTLAMIGRRIEPGGAELEQAVRQPALGKLSRWPMTISYFTAGTGDQTPAYTISFELYENGVSRALKLDYGDFALKGDLQALDVQPTSECQR
jgi:hypothetical protein